MSNWWQPELDPRLSQGDVVCDLLSVVAVFPMQAVQPSTLKGGLNGWVPSGGAPDSEGMLHVISRGRLLPSLVLSHSCDLDKSLDKNKPKVRVMMAQMMPASNLSQEDYANVFRSQVRSKIPLPDVPVLGDCYADLRLMQPVDGRFIATAQRLAS